MALHTGTGKRAQKSARNVPIGANVYHFQTAEELCALLRQEILASKDKFGAIARKANVSHSTVANIASAKTHYPRISTVFSIFEVLGLELTVRR